MKIEQLSLFPSDPKKNIVSSRKAKNIVSSRKAKLGRYERLQRELENNNDDPHKVYINVNNNNRSSLKYNFVDLFSGAGGITQGLWEAGFKPVASVEINPVASATHERNFPDCHHFCGDIQDFEFSDLLQQINCDRIHIVSGGPPCQGFSVAGKRNPDDPRNRLFYEFIRVVSRIKPWYVIMENVPGILTIKKGKVKQAIFDAFNSIGYSVSVAILESAAYRVPQIRPRAIFIANRFGRKNPYPQAQLSPKEYLSIESAISDLPEYSRIPEINHEWTRHSPEYMERIAKVAPGESLYETYADAFKRQYPGKPSMTVKENHGGTHIHPYLNRVISAREMARLQTFSDSFIFEGSMKKAMWQIGNAVPPLLARNIGFALIPYLNKIEAQQLE